MFTGIIQATGRVKSISATAAANGRLEIESALFLATGDRTAPAVGDSVAISGVCLTVTAIENERASFDLASETVRRTTLGGLETGSAVNLERSLRMGDSLDGHLVQGHVDAVSEVIAVAEEGETTAIRIKLPAVISGLVAQKGSISIDGVSLTVGPVDRESFTVYIIPHTRTATTLGSFRPGRLVNLEADCIARYVARALAVRSAGNGE